jgi:outer membrane receptor for ferric coprogen and ferric-rhodotorulic acid
MRLLITCNNGSKYASYTTLYKCREEEASKGIKVSSVVTTRY